jgi:hypothetical protein
VVAVELAVIALIRKRFLSGSLAKSLAYVGVGGVGVAFVGFALGHA